MGKAAKRKQQTTTPKRGVWKRKFIARLRETMNVSASAVAAGIDRGTAYEMRKSDPSFAQAWDDALAEAIENAEGELYRRGVTGVEEPVYQSGLEVGKITRYSDGLLKALLQAHKPERYSDRHEYSGPNGTPLPVATVIILPDDGRANRDSTAGGATDSLPEHRG